MAVSPSGSSRGVNSLLRFSSRSVGGKRELSTMRDGQLDFLAWSTRDNLMAFSMSPSSVSPRCPPAPSWLDMTVILEHRPAGNSLGKSWVMGTLLGVKPRQGLFRLLLEGCVT